MMDRRLFVAGGIALIGAPSIPMANPAVKIVGVQVWDLTKIPIDRRQKVLNAVKAQETKNRVCMTEFNFAGTIGSELRDLEVDRPGGVPGMRLSGPCRVVISSIGPDKSCAVVDERNRREFLVQDGGVLDHHRPLDDVKDRHLRVLFPESPDLKYKVLYPLVPPGSSVAETRIFSWDWEKKGGGVWSRNTVHALVESIF